MNTASAYKALCQEDKLFLLDTAQKVAMLVDKSQKRMDYFRKQLREFGEKWGAWKTAFDAERKGKWLPSMKKPDNPLETIWPRSAGAGRFPFCGGDIRPVLGGYALLAVIQNNVLPHCPSITKSILPTELGNKIWRDLITGANEEHRAIIPDATYSPRRVIPVLKIENFLRDVETDIEIHCAPKNSTKQIRRTREVEIKRGEGDFKHKRQGAEQKGDGKAENKRRVKIPASDRVDLPNEKSAEAEGENRGTKEGREEMKWDVFISHASEDKEELVQSLADKLSYNGLRVWYADFSLRASDSLRRSIDKGLAQSNFGIVVLSPHFLEKEWAQKELDGLTVREVAGRNVILPIWHNVDQQTILDYSPMLADRKAISSEQPIEKIVDELLDVMEIKSKREIGVDMVHGKMWGGLTNLLEDNAFQYRRISSLGDKGALQKVNALVIATNGYKSNKGFADDEISVISAFVNRGGILVCIDQAWSWVCEKYGNKPIEEFPLNRLGAKLGFHITGTHIGPSKYFATRIMKGIDKLKCDRDRSPSEIKAL